MEKSFAVPKLEVLLGQTVIGVSRVGILEDKSAPSPPTTVVHHTLILTVANGRKFELVCEQSRVLFAEIFAGQDLAAKFVFDLYLNLPPQLLRTGGWLAELLSRSGLKEITTVAGANPLYVLESYELEPEQTTTAEEVSIDTGSFPMPFTITGITEVWAGYGEKTFLFGLNLWTADQQPGLALYVMSHHIDLLSLEEQRRRLDLLPFTFGTAIYRYYDGRMHDGSGLVR